MVQLAEGRDQLSRAEECIGGLGIVGDLGDPGPGQSSEAHEGTFRDTGCFELAQEVVTLCCVVVQGVPGSVDIVGQFAESVHDQRH